jgi:hypothetical protein
LEKLIIWNTTSPFDIITEVELDLENKAELKEDPDKLSFLSYDSAYIFLRDMRKNVKVLSLEDGSLTGKIDNIHKNPIL